MTDNAISTGRIEAFISAILSSMRESSRHSLADARRSSFTLRLNGCRALLSFGLRIATSRSASLVCATGFPFFDHLLHIGQRPKLARHAGRHRLDRLCRGSGITAGTPWRRGEQGQGPLGNPRRPFALLHDAICLRSAPAPVQRRPGPRAATLAVWSGRRSGQRALRARRGECDTIRVCLFSG
jgi:hypothetical protein